MEYSDAALITCNLEYSVPKEISIKIISYRLQLIDSTRFIASSLLKLVNNFAEGLQKIKCKNEYGNKKCKTCQIKYRDFECFLKYPNFENDLIEYKR